MNSFNKCFDIVPERININPIMDIIYNTLCNFKKYDKDFLHHKAVKCFEDVLDRQVPQYKFQIETIYGVGRDNCFSLNYTFQELLFDSKYADLRSFVNHLEYTLIFFKNESYNVANSVEKIISSLEFYKWSINKMIQLHRIIIDDIDTILRQILILKTTNTYRYLTGDITMKDIDDQIRAQQINFSGTFQQSQIQTGANSTMNINQINNQALQQVCNQMREIIDQSSETPETKQNLKNIVAEVQTTNNPSTFKDAYTKLTGALSNHLTILGAFGSAGILMELTKYLG